jgi:hypothetical protein
VLITDMLVMWNGMVLPLQVCAAAAAARRCGRTSSIGTHVCAFAAVCGPG